MKRILRSRSIPELFQWMLRRGTGLATASQRTLPDFVIIGAQRCGTTSLYKYLCQHPDVYPSFPKEIHYFSNYYQKGTHWYRSHFPLSRHKQRTNSNGHGKFITGEATPYYLAHPHAPKRASQLVPEARLIVLLRDPVKRAYSHYFHEVSMGVETLGFEDAVHKEEERLDHEFEKMVEDENYRSFNYQHFSYLTRGIYVDQILRWRQYFTPESMLIINSDTLNSDPVNTFRKVTEFLGLISFDKVNFSKYHTAAYPPMEPETRKELFQFFLSHNQKLFELTNLNFHMGET